MSQIDISNIINVSISTAPSLLSGDNVNVIGILTKETPLFPIDGYKVYKNPNSCMQDFGSNSDTYKMVNCIFSQNLNILAGNGYVVVFPLLSNITVAATAGTLTCLNLIVSKFTSVADGSIKIKVDGGNEQALTDLDFTQCEDLTGIANVISEAFATNSIEATIEAKDTDLIITSKSTGASSSIELISDTTGTDLSTLDYFNIAQAEAVAGKAEYTGAERLQDAVARTSQLTFYEAILTTFTPTDDEVLNTAANIQSLNKMLFVCSGDKEKIAGLFTTIKNRSYTKTRCLYNGMKQTLLFAAGYVSKLLSVNFSGTGTANNLHTKDIVGIDADTTINDDLLMKINDAGVDCYASMKGLGVIYCSGKNEWVDTVLFLNWLKNALEVAGFNCLRGTPTKIAQTETGMTQLVNAYKDVLEQSIALGYVAPGSWNLPFTFGDQELFYDNIEQLGYYLYSEPVANQTQSDRDARKATLIQGAIKLAGAINSSNIILYVNN